MTSGPSEPSSASARLDQSAQAGSPDRTSIRTFESTRVAITLFQVPGAPILSPGQTHTFLGRHLDVASGRPFEVLDDLLPASSPALDLSDLDLPALRHELNLRAG